MVFSQHATNIFKQTEIRTWCLSEWTQDFQVKIQENRDSSKTVLIGMKMILFVRVVKVFFAGFLKFLS